MMTSWRPLRLSWPLSLLCLFLPPTSGCERCPRQTREFRVQMPDPELEALLVACALGKTPPGRPACATDDRECACRPACERLMALSPPSLRQGDLDILSCSPLGGGVKVQYQACEEMPAPAVYPPDAVATDTAPGDHQPDVSLDETKDVGLDQTTEAEPSADTSAGPPDGAAAAPPAP